MQAGQTRAGQRVLKPQAVLHLMFTMMGAAMVVMGKKLKAGHGIAPPSPRFLTPVGAQRQPEIPHLNAL
jgi:hypothetical protein